MNRLLTITIFLLAVVLGGPAWADRIVVETPVLPAPPKTARVAAGFAIIHNKGKEADRLVGVSADFATMVEIHRTNIVDGVMSMDAADNGLEIPANGRVVLKPGGTHLMLMGLSDHPKVGEIRALTLHFEKAGDLTVPFAVWSIGEALKLRAAK